MLLSPCHPSYERIQYAETMIGPVQEQWLGSEGLARIMLDHSRRAQVHLLRCCTLASRHLPYFRCLISDDADCFAVSALAHSRLSYAHSSTSTWLLVCPSTGSAVVRPIGIVWFVGTVPALAPSNRSPYRCALSDCMASPPHAPSTRPVRQTTCLSRCIDSRHPSHPPIFVHPGLVLDLFSSHLHFQPARSPHPIRAPSTLRLLKVRARDGHSSPATLRHLWSATLPSLV